MADINSIANISGFAGPFVLGFAQDATGGFDGGLLVSAAGSLISGIVTLCIHHETEPERCPALTE